MECPGCRRENPVDARFCMGCGRALANACAACGADLGADANFCPRCGHPASGVAPAVSPPPSAALPADFGSGRYVVKRLLGEGARLARVSFSYEGAGRDEHVAQVVAEHRAMVEAIAGRDAARAEKLGHDHAALFQRRMLAYLSANSAATLRPVSGPVA